MKLVRVFNSMLFELPARNKVCVVNKSGCENVTHVHENICFY